MVDVIGGISARDICVAAIMWRRNHHFLSINKKKRDHC